MARNQPPGAVDLWRLGEPGEVEAWMEDRGFPVSWRGIYRSVKNRKVVAHLFKYTDPTLDYVCIFAYKISRMGKQEWRTYSYTCDRAPWEPLDPAEVLGIMPGLVQDNPRYAKGDWVEAYVPGKGYVPGRVVCAWQFLDLDEYKVEFIKLPARHGIPETAVVGHIHMRPSSEKVAHAVFNALTTDLEKLAAEAKENPSYTVELGTEKGALRYMDRWADINRQPLAEPLGVFSHEDPLGRTGSRVWGYSIYGGRMVLMVWLQCRGKRKLYTSREIPTPDFHRWYKRVDPLEELALRAQDNPRPVSLPTKEEADQYARNWRRQARLPTEYLGIYQNTKIPLQLYHVYAYVSSPHGVERPFKLLVGKAKDGHVYGVTYSEPSFSRRFRRVEDLEQLAWEAEENPGYRSAVISMPSAAQLAEAKGNPMKPYDPREEQLRAQTAEIFGRLLKGRDPRKMSQKAIRDLSSKAFAIAYASEVKAPKPKTVKRGRTKVEVHKGSWLVPGSRQVTQRTATASRERYEGTYTGSDGKRRTITDLVLNRQGYEMMLAMARKRGGFYRITPEPTKTGIRYFVWPMPAGCRIPGPGTADLAEAQAIAADLNKRADPRKTNQWWRKSPRTYTKRELAHWLPPRAAFGDGRKATGAKRKPRDRRKRAAR